MAENKKKPVYITYIGNRVYTPDRFEEEAKKYGVSRAIPMFWAKKLNAGDRIYTLFKRSEYSTVTGYFVITGYSFSGPDADELRAYYREHPEEFGITDCYAGSGATIHRGCGSYVDAGGCYVSDLQGAMSKAAEVVKENGWKVKVFVNGYYVKLPQKKRVRLPFTRSIAEYYLDLDNAPGEVDKTHLGHMEDYNQITRRKKRRRKKRKSKKQ